MMPLLDRGILVQQGEARVSAGHDGLAEVLAVGRHWTGLSDFTTAPHGHESSGAGGGCKEDFKKGAARKIAIHPLAIRAGLCYLTIQL